MSASTEGIKAGAAASPALGRFAGEVRRRFLVGTLSVVSGLLVWEVLSRLVVANALFLAAPSQIARGDLFAGAKRRARPPHRGQRCRVHHRLCHRERDRHRARPRHGEQRAGETGAAAVDFRPLRDTDHCARAAVHPVARHRHLVEGPCGDLPGAVPGHHQYRGGAAHHERAPDRDAAQLRRDAAADLLQGVAALGPARSSSPASSSASAAA